jgi:hypothetical protein
MGHFVYVSVFGSICVLIIARIIFVLVVLIAVISIFVVSVFFIVVFVFILVIFLFFIIPFAYVVIANDIRTLIDRALLALIFSNGYFQFPLVCSLG